MLTATSFPCRGFPPSIYKTTNIQPPGSIWQPCDSGLVPWSSWPSNTAPLYSHTNTVPRLTLFLFPAVSSLRPLSVLSQMASYRHAHLFGCSFATTHRLFGSMEHRNLVLITLRTQNAAVPSVCLLSTKPDPDRLLTLTGHRTVTVDKKKNWAALTKAEK